MSENEQQNDDTKEPEGTNQPTDQQTETGEPKKAESLLSEGTKKTEAAPGAPEKYEPFKAPETFEAKGLKLDEKLIEKAVPIFKKLNLSQEGAQELINFYAGVSEEQQNAALKTITDMRTAWRDQVKADSEIGGEKFEKQVLPTISKAINTLGPLAEPFREAMNLTGAGDHPAVIKAVYKLASMVTEGGHVSGNGPSKDGQPTRGATGPGPQALFPELVQQN